jgi:hypothetical protein
MLCSLQSPRPGDGSTTSPLIAPKIVANATPLRLLQTGNNSPFFYSFNFLTIRAR